MTTLRGMTWAHTRGYLPMVATAQRYGELHPEVEVVWERRSLKAFEDYPIERLAADYDLIVIDHPFAGRAAALGCLLPLDENLPAEFLADQAAHSVGASHESYAWAGHQYALAIDAAAPVACWREDLLAEHGGQPPSTWEDLLAFAREGRIEVPAAPINCLMHFLALCVAHGGTPGAGPGRFVEAEAGRAAFAALAELLALTDAGAWGRNPIASLERVASARNTRVAGCMFPYGYSNYARQGYAERRLRFGDVPRHGGAPLRTVLGGTGLAVSALRPHRSAALAYAAYAAAGETQRTLAFLAGGQPGHRTAWTDRVANELTGGYFAQTLPVLDRAWLRPRHAGYPAFQEHAAILLQHALRGRTPARDALDALDALHREHLLPAA